MSERFTAIIGGNGFVGSRLARRFEVSEQAYRVLDIDDSSGASGVSYADVCDLSSLDCLEGADVIINLAAVHRDDVRPISLYDEVNVGGAHNVCRAAVKFGINRIIFTSSVAVYGFAPLGTGEAGAIDYFNDYGRTKFEAEQIYRQWQSGDVENRSLVIVRPTVIFGEGNRGNVYNLLNQINSRKFLMIGKGRNVKSMAYVENVAAFIQHCLDFPAGVHISNYVDKPDLDMNRLVSASRKTLLGKEGVGLRLPAILGLIGGYFFDVAAYAISRPLAVSSIRVKKFLSDTHFTSNIEETDFKPPVPLLTALQKTLQYEFLEDHTGARTFDTE